MNNFNKILPLIRLILTLLIIYTLLRLVFILLFPINEPAENVSLLPVFLAGTRIDLAAIFYTNFFIFLLYIIAIPWLHIRILRNVVLTLFMLINLFFIAIGYTDLIYYGFNYRRSTIDIFYTAPESAQSFSYLLKKYWYIVLFYVLTVFIIYKIASSSFKNIKQTGRKKTAIQIVMAIGVLAGLLLITIGRGGRPVTPSTPLLNFHPSLQPYINNSALNMVYSFLRYSEPVKRKKYFTNAKANAIYPVVKQYHQQEKFNNRNVVLFILESFSADLVYPESRKAVTPFFDSLLKHSTVFTAAYQNGSESVKGLPAILLSVPPFLDAPFFTSQYSSIPFNGIGKILEEKGYVTKFFLGAAYDHFNFAKLTALAGISNYYSADTFGKPAYYDGNWGIYDEYFFDYFSELGFNSSVPFFSVLYNISSHPPFKLPAHRKKEFTINSQTDQQNSISYVDDCFRRLFNNLKTREWFNNTIFIFIADHSLPEPSSIQPGITEHLKIPFFIFDPQSPVYNEFTQPVHQLDVVPTILDQLNYSDSFMSFGNSVYRNNYGFAILKNNESFQLIDSSGITVYDELSDKIIHYDYVSDEQQDQPFFLKQKEVFIKALIQQFNNSLYNNKFGSH